MTPNLQGLEVLTGPLGIILPWATATMSTSPIAAQATAMPKKRTMARAAGWGGVSWTSRAAGRKSYLPLHMSVRSGSRFIQVAGPGRLAESDKARLSEALDVEDARA